MTKGVVKSKDDRSRLTVRLGKDLDDRLLTVTKRLGITKNAYILKVIADAVKGEEQRIG